MIGWIIGGVVIISVIIIVCKMINRKNEPIRVGSLEEQTDSLFQKFGDWCCKHRKDGR